MPESILWQNVGDGTDKKHQDTFPLMMLKRHNIIIAANCLCLFLRKKKNIYL